MVFAGGGINERVRFSRAVVETRMSLENALLKMCAWFCQRLGEPLDALWLDMRGGVE